MPFYKYGLSKLGNEKEFSIPPYMFDNLLLRKYFQRPIDGKK